MVAGFLNIYDRLVKNKLAQLDLCQVSIHDFQYALIT